MKNEIAAVVFFLTRLIKNSAKLRKEDIDVFSEALTRILHEKYVNHWYPDTPSKGQAYRCIRVNRFQGVDPDLQKACLHCGLTYEDLGLPREFTLWVDPWEVCCRYGEKNHAFIVASFESEDGEKDDMSQKVTYTVDKVTSDYHSGSSSEDEVYINRKKPPTVPLVTNTYQIPEFVFPPQPVWNKYPKKKHGAQYNFHPRFVSTYQQQVRGNKMYGHMPWMPPMVQNERNHWTNLHIMTTGHQCLV
ncbi:protein BTG3 isoform 1-T1 [Discoglossus pictus]